MMKQVRLSNVDNMSSSRPYIIRALYEWIVENNFTPYILVDTAAESVMVPRSFVENGRIILNVSPDATHSLILGNDSITFNARFSGTGMDVVIPVGSVLAIYARENGQGMLFGEQDDAPTDPPPTDSADDVDGPASQAKKPNLKIVK